MLEVKIKSVFANQAGIQIDRFDFYWEGVQYINSSVFDYTGLLEFVQNLTANHIAPLGILDYGNKYLLGSGDDQYIPPDNISIWLNYVNETVDLFQNYGVYWEIWNEPNLSWTGPMNDFFYLLNRTACFIHEYYPDQKVISPGISGSWPSYLTAMINTLGQLTSKPGFMEWLFIRIVRMPKKLPQLFRVFNKSQINSTLQVNSGSRNSDMVLAVFPRIYFIKQIRL